MINKKTLNSKDLKMFKNDSMAKNIQMFCNIVSFSKLFQFSYPDSYPDKVYVNLILLQLIIIFNLFKY